MLDQTCFKLGVANLYLLQRTAAAACIWYPCSAPRASAAPILHSCGTSYIWRQAITVNITQDKTPPATNFRADFLRNQGGRTQRNGGYGKFSSRSVHRLVDRRLHSPYCGESMLGNSSKGVCCLKCYAVLLIRRPRSCRPKNVFGISVRRLSSPAGSPYLKVFEIRASKVSHAACEYQFRRNPPAVV